MALPNYYFCLSVFAITQALSKDFAKLPQLEDTFIPELGQQPEKNRNSFDDVFNNISLDIPHLRELFCQDIAFNFFYQKSHTGKERISVDIHRDFLSSSPRSLDTLKEFCSSRRRNADFIAIGFQRRVRTRGLLRIHLAITRQKNLKSSTSNESKSAEEIERLSIEGKSEQSSVGGKNTIILNNVDSIFRSAVSCVQFSRSTEKTIVRDMLFATNMTMSVATIRGMRGLPQYDNIVRMTLNAVVEILSQFLADLKPLPKRSTTLEEQDANTKCNEATLSAKCAVAAKWIRSISNSSLSFEDDDVTASRPGSASSFPAALVRPLENVACMSVQLVDAKQANNWLTIGLASAAFPTTSSDGFGRTPKSW